MQKPLTQKKRKIKTKIDLGSLSEPEKPREIKDLETTAKHLAGKVEKSVDTLTDAITDCDNWIESMTETNKKLKEEKKEELYTPEHFEIFGRIKSEAEKKSEKSLNFWEG